MVTPFDAHNDIEQQAPRARPHDHVDHLADDRPNDKPYNKVYHFVSSFRYTVCRWQAAWSCLRLPESVKVTVTCTLTHFLTIIIVTQKAAPNRRVWLGLL